MELSIGTKVVEEINYAAVSCGETVMSDIIISNKNAGEEKHAVLRIETVPEVLYIYEDEIILSGAKTVVKAPKLILNPEYWTNHLAEGLDGEIKVEIVDAEDREKVLAFNHYPVRIQPYLHWDMKKYPKTLAAFRQPNHPLIAKVLQKAGDYANEAGIRLYAYYSDGKRSVEENARLLAEVVYKALMDANIHYISYPPSYEMTGQKIRIPAFLLNENVTQGTCLDLAVLYASCLETVGLHPVPILIRGHAFVAVWLRPELALPGGLCTDGEFVRENKVSNGGFLLPVECTTFTDGGYPFEEAVKNADRSIDKCLFAVDIEKASAEGIHPAFAYTAQPICTEREDYKESEVPKAQEVSEEDRKYLRVTKTGLTKMQRLQKQAMELTAGNHLLSRTKDADQVSFPLLAANFFADEYEGRKLYLHAKNCVLKTGVSEKNLNQVLRRLWVLNNQAEKEKGKEILYLAINELICKREKDKGYLHAPVFLSPVQIDKDNRGEYFFQTKDEVFFNPVLKEFLLQEFEIDVSEIENFSQDQYKEQMEYLRYCTAKKKDWKVCENVAYVSAFHIPNEAILNGLKNPKLLEHKIVAGFVNGSVDWEDKAAPEKMASGFEDYTVYALPTDHSQSEIIRSVQYTPAQVVIGPAGNGKSQTAVNIIADGISRGEKILFVSEKLAAMEVIRGMLKKTGLDMFSLYLTGEKHTTASVLEQIEQTLYYIEQSDRNKTEVYEDHKYKTAVNRLVSFHSSMKKTGECGQSIQSLIELHEKLRDIPDGLSWRKARTSMNHERAEEIVDAYIEALRYCGVVDESYMKFISAGSLQPEAIKEVGCCVDHALRKLEELKASLKKYEEETGVLPEVICEKEKITQLVLLAFEDQREDVMEAWASYAQAQAQADTYVLQDGELFALEHPDELKAALLKAWKEYALHAKDVLAYQKIYKEAEEIGFGSILEQMEQMVKSGHLSIDQLKDAFTKCWCEYNIEKIRKHNMDLNCFDPVQYRVAVNQYRAQEEKLREYLHKKLSKTQMERVPDMKNGVKDPQWGKLNKAVRRKGKGFCVRALLEQAPDLLAELYPCMLMTPDAVAELLPENFPEFDLILVDEGSQLPTYEALIPISKGKRCLIFGDEKQLTPTRFFRKKLEEEDGFMTPEESILEDALTLGIPKKMLKCHYRSENDLIAFSNAMFYNNDVTLAPSCKTQVSGIDYIYLENGCYDRGKSKTNMPEAKRAIAQIGQILTLLPENTKETIGVITTNVNQRDLIYSMLLSECQKNPKMAEMADEQIEVVTVENCQGNEWDHVILSFNFGPDENGMFVKNFGPLGEGGSRLNVMVTRARKHMYVITSMTPDMLGEDLSEGGQFLKKYLLFAKGDLRLDKRTGKSFEDFNAIAESVAEKLRKKGYEVHTNIGSSRMKVDIGVVSKENPDVYELGILLDDFSKSGCQVKDREIIFPDMLRKKGWKVYRLHSLNWYDNAEYEMAQILRILEGKVKKTA